MILTEATPYWDQELRAHVIRETENWIIYVTPMIYNERIMLANKDEFPYMYTAGFCYDKGMAVPAAMVWDPETQRYPLGMKKLACDARPNPERLSWTQAICRWCFLDREHREPPSRLKDPEPEICCDCGTVTRDGVYFRIDPNTVRYPGEKED